MLKKFRSDHHISHAKTWLQRTSHSREDQLIEGMSGKRVSGGSGSGNLSPP